MLELGSRLFTILTLDFKRAYQDFALHIIRFRTVNHFCVFPFPDECPCNYLSSSFIAGNPQKLQALPQLEGNEQCPSGTEILF
jgi:hypothetical protein